MSILSRVLTTLAVSFQGGNNNICLWLSQHRKYDFWELSEQAPSTARNRNLLSKIIWLLFFFPGAGLKFLEYAQNVYTFLKNQHHIFSVALFSQDNPWWCTKWNLLSLWWMHFKVQRWAWVSDTKKRVKICKQWQELTGRKTRVFWSGFSEVISPKNLTLLIHSAVLIN